MLSQADIRKFDWQLNVNRNASIISNKDIDAVEVPKIYTRSLTAVKVVCTYFTLLLGRY